MLNLYALKFASLSDFGIMIRMAFTIWKLRKYQPIFSSSISIISNFYI
jgi:hypothetical protein